MSETEKSQQEPKGKPISDEIFNRVLGELTGGKSPEQIRAEVDAGRWPFAVSEEQMRADIARWETPVGEKRLEHQNEPGHEDASDHRRAEGNK